ncbi:MAG: hypothetical protein ABEI52_09670 [Halobacteriaceae archaeon]
MSLTLELVYLRAATMSDMDPVSWDAIEPVIGHPAGEIPKYIDRYRDAIQDSNPYDAVKTIHDALSRDIGEDLTVSGQGEVFITTYLLEKEDIISFEDEEFSPLERRPDADGLEEMYWENERTMWWIATKLGVHWALVRLWLYEEDLPLRKRNFGESTMAKIQGHQR